MKVYEYKCSYCDEREERFVIDDLRDRQNCYACGLPTRRLPAAPMGRVAGRAVDGGGPDRFTADALGMKVADLPSGLRTK